MDLINKLKVLMKISLAGNESQISIGNGGSVGGDGYSEKTKGQQQQQQPALRLSHHYLAQCLHKQCDMYELREMCRLQKVEVKRGAGKREIIESLIDHLPDDVNFYPSPKEVSNKTRKMKKINANKSPKNTTTTTTTNVSSSSLSSPRYDLVGVKETDTLNLKRVPGKDKSRKSVRWLAVLLPCQSRL